MEERIKAFWNVPETVKKQGTKNFLYNNDCEEGCSVLCLTFLIADTPGFTVIKSHTYLFVLHTAVEFHLFHDGYLGFSKQISPLPSLALEFFCSRQTTSTAG